MDGSYGNVFPAGRGMSPNPPAASGSGGQYKINVNRQKTRKWANFKPQNYDGDDWGTEDDEPPHDPAPPVPTKPMGPRHQAAHSATGRPLHAVGSPPPRASTHQHAGPPPAMPGQSPTGFGPPRSATDSFGDPQNTVGHPEPHSPDAWRAPPAQLPSQRNMAASDQAVRQSGSGPRPWVDTRPASPQHPRPLVSPTKRLPFVRPADVYQRMEEERERERRSPDAGRPSADRSAGQGAAEASRGVVQPFAAHAMAAGDTSAGRTLGAESGATPADERKSEYGVERLIASYGGDRASVGPPASPHEQENPAGRAEHEQSSPENIRRYSTSPQLPVLTRMSGFGEELFSTSFLSPPGLRSPVSDTTQLPASDRHMDDIPESPAGQSDTAAAPLSAAASTAPQADLASQAGPPQRDLPADAVSPTPDAAGQDQPAGPPGPLQPDVSGQQTSVPDAAREPASSSGDQPAALTTRPRLPGSWVTETPSSPAELPASPPAGPSQGPPIKMAESGPVPSADAQPPAALDASKSDEADTAQVQTTKDSMAPSHPASPRALTPLRTSSPASAMSTQKVAGDDLASPSPGIRVSDSAGPTPASVIPPTAPLNPRRGSPNSATSAKAVSPRAPSDPSPDAQTPSQIKDSDALSEEIMRSLGPASGAARGSTLGPLSAAADPARESSYLGDVYGDYWSSTDDKVEAGLLTLGKAGDAAKPAKEPSPLAVEVPDGSAAPRHLVSSDSPASPSRPAPPPPAESAAGSGGAQARYAWESSTPTDAAPALGALPTRYWWEAPAPSSTPPAESGVGIGGAQARYAWESSTPTDAAPALGALPTRYSWEAPAPSSTLPAEHAVEQKALGSGAQNMMAAAAVELDATDAERSRASASASASASDREKSAEDLRAESAPELDPSARPADAPSSPSSAEEKIVLHDAPAPPSRQDDQPALAEPQHHQQQEEEPLPPLPRRPEHLPDPPLVQNIVAFRTIMEMPDPAERIRHYAETRRQFAAVDTGLDEWLRVVLARHPEHADAAADGVAGPGSGSGTGAGAGADAGGGDAAGTHQHQHHHHHHHLHMANLQHGLSGLGHSGNQVGTKSKELLMAAGKAGKGLFSKGRNKLRGREG